MKKLSLIISLFFICVLTISCVSTSSTFGDPSQSTSGDVTVFTDKFTLSKTYEYSKGMRGGFALSRGGLTTDYLEIYPHFVINEDNLCSAFLRINYTGSSGGLLTTASDKVYKKFIFLNDNGKRLTISPIVNPNAERAIGAFSTYSSPVIEISSTYSMQITKEQFNLLRDFFSSSGSIECGAYSIDDTVVTFKSYNDKWHQNIFTALANCVQKENPDILFNELVTQAIIE